MKNYPIILGIIIFTQIIPPLQTTIQAKKFHPHQSLLQRFPSYKSTSSIGKVKKVIRGDLIELDNQIQVKLQDIIAPPPNHPHKGLACFGKNSKKFLEDLILNQKVLLIKDRISPPENHHKITRHVFIIEKENQTLLNLFLIQKGHAKFSPAKSTKSGKFWKVLAQNQNNIYKNPQGSWKKCATELQK